MTKQKDEPAPKEIKFGAGHLALNDIIRGTNVRTSENAEELVQSIFDEGI